MVDTSSVSVCGGGCAQRLCGQQCGGNRRLLRQKAELVGSSAANESAQTATAENSCR